ARVGYGDLLQAGVLAGCAVGADPEAGWSARGAAVHVATEDEGAARGAMGEEGSELGALRIVAGHFVAHARVEVGGADLDLGCGHAEPAALLDALLCPEGLVVGALDRGLGEDGVAEHSPTARLHA